MRTQAPDEPVHISTINGLASPVWDRDGDMVIREVDGTAIQTIAHVLEQAYLTLTHLALSADNYPHN